jgi:hypothetical protein
MMGIESVGVEQVSQTGRASWQQREAARSHLTVRQLRQSGLIGMWKDRDDIRDSAAYARRLREQAQRRRDINYDFE